MCDDLEMAEYVRTENYRFKKYWLLAKKEELKAKLDEMKANLSKFTFLPDFKSEKTPGKPFYEVIFVTFDFQRLKNRKKLRGRNLL